jgi:hypothetical protein
MCSGAKYERRAEQNWSTRCAVFASDRVNTPRDASKRLFRKKEKWLATCAPTRNYARESFPHQLCKCADDLRYGTIINVGIEFHCADPPFVRN